MNYELRRLWDNDIAKTDKRWSEDFPIYTMRRYLLTLEIV